MTTVYFAGGEDLDHFQNGGGIVSTSGGTFRSAFARCSLEVGPSSNCYWQNYVPYVGAPSSFWWSGYMQTGAGNISFTNQLFLSFVDILGFTRLRLRTTASTNPSPINVEKMNTAGSTTTLTNTLAPWSISATGSPDKIDVHWVNAVSGSLDIYYNGVHVFNFVGDTTTEVTGISYHRAGPLTVATNSALWSEMMALDIDTRSLNLQTLAPLANGNTHNFNVGSPAASNVNEIVINDSTLDGSDTAGQVDQYTTNGIAAGTYSIYGFGVSARMQRSVFGPAKMDLGVRSASTDYWSSDITLTTAWTDYQNWWTTDPATSTIWLSLPANIGLRSVT